MAFIFTLLFILTSSSAWAYELIMIQAVSATKKTFITRNGKRQGLINGVTGTFTADNVSILAKTVNVTGNFAQWEVMNPDLNIPFEKGAIVTYYPAAEYIWALAPEIERKKYIKSRMPKLRRSFVARGAITRTLQESVSDAPATESERGGVTGEIYFERDLTASFAFDLGVRYEREIINYSGASYTTQRQMLIGDILYYFTALEEYVPGRFFLGVGIGWGNSTTSTVGLEQSGIVGLLPVAKIGVTYPFNDDWEFVMDGAFESLQTKEAQEGGREQTTTQTNLKTGIGLRRYF